MSALRRLLGRGKGGRNYIETVPKRGYRFTAPVTELTPEALVVEKRTLTRVMTEETVKDDSQGQSMIGAGEAPGVKVISRSSSFQYKGKETNPQEVATALGVEAVVTGRVFQRDNSLHISVELINARDRTQIWGEQYNRQAAEVLAVQQDISREIAERLRLKLTEAEQQQFARRETVNPQAYESLLKGRFYWNKGGTEERKKAIDYYQLAIVADPTYALFICGRFNLTEHLLQRLLW